MVEKAIIVGEIQYKQKRNRLLIVSFIMMIVFIFTYWMWNEGNLMMVVVGVISEIPLALLLYWIAK